MDRRQAIKLFGLPGGFTASDLHAAYRSRIKSVHPDHAGAAGAEAARDTIEAYGLLAGEFDSAEMILAQTRRGQRDRNGHLSRVGEPGQPGDESASGPCVEFRGPGKHKIGEGLASPLPAGQSPWDWVALKGKRFPRV